jgi:hypothetical protein
VFSIPFWISIDVGFVAVLAAAFAAVLVVVLAAVIGFTFLAWAVCHTIYLCIESLTRKTRSQLSEKFNTSLCKLICVFIVFNLVCFSNIFFRADTLETAMQLIKSLFINFFPVDLFSGFVSPLAVGGHQMDEFNLFITVLFPVIFLLFERKIFSVASSEKVNLKFILVSLLLIMVFGVFNSGMRFIYMQF